jgi:hypothetical protein
MGLVEQHLSIIVHDADGGCGRRSAEVGDRAEFDRLAGVHAVGMGARVHITRITARRALVPIALRRWWMDMYAIAEAGGRFQMCRCRCGCR